MRDVLLIMLKAARDGSNDLFPRHSKIFFGLAEQSSNPIMERKRIAVDYVAGMTEREFRETRLLTRS